VSAASYVEYEIDDLASMRAVADSAESSTISPITRTLQVGVRVGNAFDSSLPTQDRGAGVVPSLADLTVPLDDNLRRHSAPDLVDH
jgi:hypothetical protein